MISNKDSKVIAQHPAGLTLELDSDIYVRSVQDG